MMKRKRNEQNLKRMKQIFIDRVEEDKFKKWK